MKKVLSISIAVLIVLGIGAMSPLHAAKYKEAPELAALVKAGKLPPVEQRLPKNPLVVKPIMEIGKYGGTLKRGYHFLFKIVTGNITREPLISYNTPFPGAAAPQPNIAESWSYSADGKTMTLKIREGIKWSDGKPYTTDDIMFFWYDVMLNDKVTFSMHNALYIGPGEVPKLVQVDAYTIQFVFPKPYKYIENSLAGVEDTFGWPKHYLKDDHPKYNESATYDNFNKKWTEYYDGRGKVTLKAWMLESNKNAEKVVMVRNPYYWKVDTEGNQLPYVDKVENYKMESRPAIAMANITGEHSFDGMWVGNGQLQLFMKEKPKRNFNIGWFLNTNGLAIHFNYDHEDPKLREIFRNLEFRKAFSLAINRAEISTLFYQDLLTANCFCFNPNSPYTDPKVNATYTQFDLSKANSILDAAGFKDTNGDGIREAPNGRPLEIIIDFIAGHPSYTSINEYIVDDMKKVGIKYVLNPTEQKLLQAKKITKDWELHGWDMNGSNAPLASLEAWIAASPDRPFWHQDASKAPFSPEYKEFTEILLGAKALDYETRVKEMKRANKIAADNLFGVLVGYYKRPFIYQRNIGNMTPETVRDPVYGLLEGMMLPEQIYFK